MRFVRATQFRKCLWLNGRGVAWNIAAEPATALGAADGFDWRCGFAEVVVDSPFSVYGPVDRIFTMISGNGLELRFADGHKLLVDKTLVPHRFGCDDAIDCFLRDGPCTALNLFTVRDICTAQAHIRTFQGVETGGNDKTTTLIYALEATLALAADGVGGLLHKGEVAIVKSTYTSAAPQDGLQAWVGEVRNV